MKEWDRSAHLTWVSRVHAYRTRVAFALCRGQRSEDDPCLTHLRTTPLTSVICEVERSLQGQVITVSPR